MKLLEIIYDWLSSTSPWKKLEIHKKEILTDKLFEESNPEFSKWAFGDQYEGMSLKQKWLAWNNLHPELQIDQIDHMADAIPEMGDLWLKSIQGK